MGLLSAQSSFFQPDSLKSSWWSLCNPANEQTGRKRKVQQEIQLLRTRNNYEIQEVASLQGLVGQTRPDEPSVSREEDAECQAEAKLAVSLQSPPMFDWET